MMNEILTTLGIALPISGAGIKGWLNLRDRVKSTEDKQESHHEIVLVKLDSISEKIDFRCDAIEKRVDRIERKVLNGEYKGDH